MKKILTAIIFSIIAISFFACSSGGGGKSGSDTSLVTVKVSDGGKTASMAIEKNTVFAQVKRFFEGLIKSGEAFAAVPSGVAKISFTVSASDMTTMTRDVTSWQSDVVESFDVPNGSQRRFQVSAYDSNNTLRYTGEKYEDLDGSNKTVTVNMTAVVTEVPPDVVTEAPSAKYVFVSNADSDDVSVINPATLAVVATLDCSSLGEVYCNEPRNLAASHDGTKVYVPFRHSDNVIVIDPVTLEVMDEISSVDFDEPYAVAFTDDDAEAWVVNKQGGGSYTGSVTIINTVTKSVVTTINDECFSSPEGIAIANGKAYVANRGSGNVCIVDVASRTVNTTITVGGEPRFAVATPDEALVYISTGNKINTSTDTYTAIGVGGRNLAVSPDGSKVYFGSQGSTINVIKVSDDTVSSITFPTAYSIYGVAVLSDGSRGFATDEDRNVVYVFDPATGTVITDGGGSPLEISVGSTPRAIVATPGLVRNGHILDANTVALWRLNEALASSNAADDTGSYFLTQFGSPGIIPGQIDNGRLLNGSTKFFQRPGDANLGTVFNGAWTYEGWVYLDPSFSVAANLFIYNGLQFSFNPSDTILAEVGVKADRKIYWHQWHSTSTYTEVASNAVLQTGQFYHIAVSRTAQGDNFYTYRLYVNGVIDTTTTDVAGLNYAVSGASHYIGLGNYTGIAGFGTGGNVLNGRLDDTRISKVARSAAEILQSYQRGL
ncbi:MAG: hypothetical protein HY808_12540 [Nitrospirae bacterium]|nr:hypothetical protein [Nitrospirota bacterium]